MVNVGSGGRQAGTAVPNEELVGGGGHSAAPDVFANDVVGEGLVVDGVLPGEHPGQVLEVVEVGGAGTERCGPAHARG